MNLTTFRCVLHVTWFHRVRFSCHLRPKHGTIHVCKLEVLTSHLVQHIRWCAAESEIYAPNFTQIRARFTDSRDCEIRTNSSEIRTNFVPISHEFGTNFMRTCYEFRTIFVGHWQKSHTNTTYACNEVPTPTHISLNLPPPPGAHTHTDTNTHRHRNTHIPSMKANSPPLDSHPHTARPHTLIPIWTVDVSRFNA